MNDRRSERGRETRRAIVAAAAELFARDGYERVPVEAVLRATQVSRGALYHHFAGMEQLFVAVLETVEERVARTVAAAAAPAAEDPLRSLRAGARAWLALAASDAEVRRIVLLDAPAVLGWERWREIEGRYVFGMLRAGLRAAGDAGAIPPERAEMYAHVLLAAAIELALVVARDATPAVLAAAGETVDAVIDSFGSAAPRRALT